MKNTKKLLAILLAGIMVFSIFTVSASAKTMTKNEVVDFYHALLEKTAEKHEKVFIIEEYECEDYADLSDLTYLDRLATEEEYGISETVRKENFDSGMYYYGFLEDGQEELMLYDYFEVDYYLEIGYEIYDATYTGNKIVINLIYDDLVDYINKEITVYLTENKGIKRIVENNNCAYSYNSSLNNEHFAILSDSISDYAFSYKPVETESITFSETEVTLGYKDMAEIEYIVNPSNATYKGIYIGYTYEIETEIEPINAYEEDGRIIIEGLNEGTSTVFVYAALGDVVEEIEVTVEFTFFDRIHKMFDDMIENIRMMFGLGY